MRALVAAVVCLLAQEAWAGPKTAKLIVALQSSDSVKLRANAARLLGKDGSPEALDALLQAMEDPAAVVRATVCFSLVPYVDKRVKSALAQAQNDGNGAVKRAATSALKEIAAAHPLTAAATGKQPGLSLVEIRGGVTPHDAEMHQMLRDAIERVVNEGNRFTLSQDVPRGYTLGGGLQCEDRTHGTQASIHCKVNLVVSRQPGKVVLGSVGAQAEAAVANPKDESSRSATTHALIKALAKSLVEDMVAVVNQDRGQNGEEEL